MDGQPIDAIDQSNFVTLFCTLTLHVPVVEGDHDIQVLKVLPVDLSLGVDGLCTLWDRVTAVLQLPQVLHLSQQGYQLWGEGAGLHIYTPSLNYICTNIIYTLKNNICLKQPK